MSTTMFFSAILAFSVAFPVYSSLFSGTSTLQTGEKVNHHLRSARNDTAGHLTERLPSHSLPSFKDIDYIELKARSDALSGRFARVRTAMEIWGIQESVSSKSRDRCSPIVMRISDHSTLSSDLERPQVLISGEIHGDERVGPLSSLFTAELLVLSARCEIELSEESCARLIDGMSLTREQVTWLAFLSTRRDSFILPAANCLGYISKRRSEDGLDPNRDFSYGRTDANCFRTNTARTFRALFATSLIQLVTTFHGGMVAIGYEWGAINHLSPTDYSPDDNAHREVAMGMSAFAGGFKKGIGRMDLSIVKEYPHNRINSIVYPVEGGMEDWMYASAWDKKGLKTCSIDIARRKKRRENARKDEIVKGGNVSSIDSVSEGVDGSDAVERYESSVTGHGVANGEESGEENGRAAVFLVETSDNKTPDSRFLGNPKNVLVNDPSIAENGHIPRNTRLSLMSLDIVQPYICIDKIDFSAVHPQEDTSPRDDRSNNDSSNRTEGSGEDRRMRRNVFQLEWSVGGSVTVDATWPEVRRIKPKALLRDRDRDRDRDRGHRMGYNRDVSKDQDLAEEEIFGDWSRVMNSVDAPISSPLYAQSGDGRWAKDRAKERAGPKRFASSFLLSPEPESGGYRPENQSEKASKASSPLSMAMPFPTEEGDYWLSVWARVDSSWAAFNTSKGQNRGSEQKQRQRQGQGHGQGYPQDSPPQTHLANARGNPNWERRIAVRYIPQSEREVRVVRGRTFWMSDPIVLRVYNISRGWTEREREMEGSVVYSDGVIAVSVLSYVTSCAWWRRVETGKTSNLSSASTSNSTPSSTIGKGPIAAVSSRKKMLYPFLRAMPVRDRTRPEKEAMFFSHIYGLSSSLFLPLPLPKDGAASESLAEAQNRGTAASSATELKEQGVEDTLVLEVLSVLFLALMGRVIWTWFSRKRTAAALIADALRRSRLEEEDDDDDNDLVLQPSSSLASLSSSIIPFGQNVTAGLVLGQHAFRERSGFIHPQRRRW